MSDSHRRSYGFRTVLWLVSALVFSTVAAVAQLSTASLNGVVRDTTGASVLRASVTLHNSDTGVERNTFTNDAGTYVFSDINPGRYTLRVTAPSFSSKQVSDFVLAVNQNRVGQRFHQFSKPLFAFGKSGVDRRDLRRSIGDSILQFLIEALDFRIRLPVHRRSYNCDRDYDQGRNRTSVIPQLRDTCGVREIGG